MDNNDECYVRILMTYISVIINTSLQLGNQHDSCILINKPMLCYLIKENPLKIF